MALWSTAYQDSLPDSAFLYVEPGGKKDSEGKTVPRSNRHFPVKDINGTIDLAHVRNALARIPQSNVPSAVKAAATSQATRMLASAKKMSEKVSTLVHVKEFAESIGEDGSAWIQWAPLGSWSHPDYGRVSITTDRAAEMVKSFHDGVRGQDILTDYDHGLDANKGGRASGQIVDAELRNDGVWTKVKFTDTARAEIAAGEWKYFSPEFFDTWTNPSTDTTHKNVMSGGALTNKPFIKGMVPINFSEVVLNDDFTKYKMGEEGQLLILADDEWREATTDEVSELEHSDPGTGIPPAPRLDEDDKSGDKDNSGSRRDSPPAAFDPENLKEGSTVKLNKEALEALGLDPDEEGEVEESAVNDGVLALFNELAPHRVKSQREKKFAEEYPDEAAELERSREIRLAGEAKQFSEKYQRIMVINDDPAIAPTRSTRGLTAVALDKVAETHRAFSEGKTEDGLKAFGELMEVVTSDKGIIDYGESGSSRDNNGDEPLVATSRMDAAKQLSEAAKKLQVTEEMSYGDALSKVMRENPELAKAYNEPAPRES